MIDLVNRFRGQVFGLCYRMLGQRQDAEDAAQETFVRVLKNLHRWDPARPFEPWLLTIAGNRCRTGQLNPDKETCRYGFEQHAVTRQQRLCGRRRDRFNIDRLVMPAGDHAAASIRESFVNNRIEIQPVVVQDDYFKQYPETHYPTSAAALVSCP